MALSHARQLTLHPIEIPFVLFVSFVVKAFLNRCIPKATTNQTNVTNDLDDRRLQVVAEGGLGFLFRGAWAWYPVSFPELRSHPSSRIA